MRPCTRPDCPNPAWFDEGGPALCRNHLAATGRDLPPPLAIPNVEATSGHIALTDEWIAANEWQAAVWSPGDPLLLPPVPESAYDEDSTPLDTEIVATLGCQETEGS